MRAFHAFVVSAALFILAIGAMPVLHGGWDAVAGGVMLLSAITSMLAFALVRSRIRRGRSHRNALVGLRRRRCASVRRGRRPEGRPLRRRSHLADRRAPACPRPAPRGLGRAAGARAQAAQAASERPIRGAAGRARAAQRSRHAARPPARDRGRSALRHACEADRLRRRQQRRRRNGRRRSRRRARSAVSHVPPGRARCASSYSTGRSPRSACRRRAPTSTGRACAARAPMWSATRAAPRR